MLMTTVQLHGASDYDSQMAMNILTANTDISLAREFQKHILDPTWAHGLLDHGKCIKCASKWNWNERDYHVQDNKDVYHISVRISCETTQFPELSFCGLHAKPHRGRGLSKHYHF